MKAAAIWTRLDLFLDWGKSPVFYPPFPTMQTENNLIIPIISSNHLCHAPFDSVTCQDLPIGTGVIFRRIVSFLTEVRWRIQIIHLSIDLKIII